MKHNKLRQSFATIEEIHAMEILDSRGNPTIRTFIKLNDGTIGVASVPSGASTGENEAVELRDGQTNRYLGKGVLDAVDNVNDVITPKLIGMEANRQGLIDQTMLDLDGTAFKKKLGANAILSVSMAASCTAAKSANLELYEYLGSCSSYRLPVPMMNVINGGEHADNSVDLQEFMIMPIGAPNFREALRYGAEVFHTLKKILHKKDYATNVGDEGGFAPNLKSNEEALEILVEAIDKAGYEVGQEIAIAIDAAASSFYQDNQYSLHKSGQGTKTTREMIDLYKDWFNKYPIISIEDPLNEHDWAGFSTMMEEVGEKVQIVGDDLFVTNTDFVEKGIIKNAANAVLIKVNQIGTISETLTCIDLCRHAGWNYIISHRSGETEDTFIADLAVATGSGQIKTGSASRSDRIAKYNRLLEIQEGLGKCAGFGTSGAIISNGSYNRIIRNDF